MGTYVLKSIPGVEHVSLFFDCLLILDEPHKVGDIIDGRIILTNPTHYVEEPVTTVYDKGCTVKAVRIDLIDDIETDTDMTPYGFTKVDNNRYCKSNEAIFGARIEGKREDSVFV